MSFKVICINAKAQFMENEGKLKDGAEYTVIGDSLIGTDGNEGYLLAEAESYFPGYGFRKSRFVRVNGPCEVAIAEARIAADAAELDIEWSRLVIEYENA